MTFNEIQHKRILYSCLDWGSGHVSRSIGIIRELQKGNNSVFLFCSEYQKQIFEQYKLSVTYLVGDKFRFSFKGEGNFSREMLRNGLRFRKSVSKEKKLTHHLVNEYNIELVISDHCYGFYSESIPSIFITHQVQLPPRSGFLAQRIHQKWMSKFNEVWIVDNEEKRLAGQLSTPIEKSTFIGWFSRFSSREEIIEPGKIVGVVSGPEPYTEQLFNWIIEQYGNQNLVIVAPKKYENVPANVRVITGWIQADKEILSAETIISRNGYSTLMDLQFLNKKAILIPTPGQLEQDYLATLSGIENMKPE